jgi:hypothetical protein
MSSSAFSFADFDSLLQSTTGDSAHVPPAVPSSSRSSVLTVSTSSATSAAVPGESSTVLVDLVRDGPGGNAGGAGGFQGDPQGVVTGSPPSRRGTLILDPSTLSLCLGLIANSKFCTKSLVGEAASCGAASHAKKFHPPSLTAFLKENEVRAFCSPALDLSILTPTQRLRIQGVQLTQEEWIKLFQQLEGRSPPKWLAFEENPVVPIEEEDDIPTVDLKSPAHSTAGTLLGLIPMLSFDSASSTEGSEGELLEDTAAHIKQFRGQFATLKSKWLRAFSEVESGYSLIVQDLQKMHRLILAQAASLGAPDSAPGNPVTSVWDGLSQVRHSVSAVSSTVQVQTATLEQLSEEQDTLTHSVIALETSAEDLQTSLSEKITSVTIDLRALENRVLRLVPLLSQLKRGNHTSVVTPTSQVHDRLRACEDSVAILKSLVTDMQTSSATTSTVNPFPSALESQIKEIQVQIQQLQHKIVGKGVQIGNKTFQSFEDVKQWVTAQLPNHRYGLFVDGVSLFEFFSAGHIDAETTYSSFYSQHRTGFKSTFEARVASSVQNLFPTVFGKSDSNVDTSEALPALPNPDRWDSNDGNTGLRHQIMRNMPDVELQIQETINTVLGDYTEAQHLARECLHQSKRFALELCQFISMDFQKWKHRGHSKKDAWKMTSVCVRRIFEELYSERVVARDVYDQGNPSFTTAKYLWATWRAHTVMANYLRHQFYEHPSISAVLARHLADNYVKPDDAQASKIKTLEGKIASLECVYQSLQSKYDALRVAKDKADKADTAFHPHKGKNGKGQPVAGSG